MSFLRLWLGTNKFTFHLHENIELWWYQTKRFCKCFLWKTALTDSEHLVYGEPEFGETQSFPFIVVLFSFGDSLSYVLITAPYRPKGFDGRHRWKRCIRLRSVSNHFHLTGTKATYLSPVTCLSDFSVTPVTTKPWIFWPNWMTKNPHWCSVLVCYITLDICAA